jgi:hypothetical protein
MTSYSIFNISDTALPTITNHLQKFGLIKGFSNSANQECPLIPRKWLFFILLNNFFGKIIQYSVTPTLQV